MDYLPDEEIVALRLMGRTCNHCAKSWGEMCAGTKLCKSFYPVKLLPKDDELWQSTYGSNLRRKMFG